MTCKSLALGPGEPGGDCILRFCSKHSVRKPTAMKAMRVSTITRNTRVCVDIVITKGFGVIRLKDFRRVSYRTWTDSVEGFGAIWVKALGRVSLNIFASR